MIAEACVMAFDCLGQISTGALALLCVAGGELSALQIAERSIKVLHLNRYKIKLIALRAVVEDWTEPELNAELRRIEAELEKDLSDNGC